MRTKLAALVVALLIGGAGAAAATGGVTAVDAANEPLADRPANVDVDAELDNDTVTLLVTDADTPYEGVSVSVDDERVGPTDANGTVTFAAGTDSEVEVELSAPGFEGEVEYTVVNGSLLLESEEYEYESVEREDGDDSDETDSDDADDGDERDVPEEAADAPGHDGDLPAEASDGARENAAVGNTDNTGDTDESDGESRRGPPADVPADDERDSEAERDEDDDDADDEDEDGDDDEDDNDDDEGDDADDD